jgi:predicted HAD superfamily Cof-like phosphohydrolase
MLEQLKKVKEFHERFGLTTTQNYDINPNVYKLRYALGQEELNEYLNAAHIDDKVEIADALGDQLYILFGTIISHGLEDKIVEIFDEIHRSNMSKLGLDGKPIYREDGKVQKGPNFFKPNIERILDETT